VTILCRTHGGKICKVLCLIGAAIIDPTGAAIVAIRNVIDALSSAKITGASISKTATANVTSATGVYGDDQDKAFLTLVDANSQHETYRIGSPNENIFDEDGQVLPAAPGMPAFISWVTTNAKSASGAAITAYVGGQRGRLASGGRA